MPASGRNRPLGRLGPAWARTWPASLEQARALQERLRRRVVLADRLGPLSLVAGVDVHYPPDDDQALAAAVLLSFPGLEPLEQALARLACPFPYRSGYLSFREAPAAQAALSRLSRRPGLLLCDGQGLAHPRRFGLACHLGLLAGLPAIGVAKTPLVGGRPQPGPARGQWEPLIHQDQVVGAALRTQDGVRPVYVSPGHRLSLPTAIALTLACAPRFRLPEPLRLAHRLAKAQAGP